MNGREPSLKEKGTHCQASGDDLVQLTERELTAFAGAVNELFGPERAQVSADEWIEELLSADQPIGHGIPDLRRITIIAASRLASRLCESAE